MPSGARGDAGIGAVSTLNGGLTDDILRAPSGRLPAVEEHEPPRRLPVSDEDRRLGRPRRARCGSAALGLSRAGRAGCGPPDARSEGMANHLHRGDLPDGLDLGPMVAVDCETMGLNPHRDRLCLVQLSAGDGEAHLVQIARGQRRAPNLERMLADRGVLKLFHFARFDIAALHHAFGVTARPVWCTKIAAKLTRTFTDRHGLKHLLADILNIDISKQQQTSDWGAEVLTEAQLAYAASDVLHLHRLKEALEALLIREGRLELARACFDFLPTRALLDLEGWPDTDIFAH